ncbi:hypothetical protein PO909_002286 [Leuciscus waleckii]
MSVEPLRAAPHERERSRSPLSLGPQETGVSIPPPMALRDTSVSGERILLCPASLWPGSICVRTTRVIFDLSLPVLCFRESSRALAKHSTPAHSHDKDYAQMPSFPINVEEALVSVPRACVGSVMSPEGRFDRRVPHRLGRGHGRPLYKRSVAEPTFLLAHKLPGDVGGFPGSEELSPRSQGSPRSCENRQYVSGVLFKPSGGTEVTPSMQTGASDSPLVSRETVVSQSNVRPRGPKPRSRRPVEAGAEARGMEAPPGCGGLNMSEVRPSGSGFICVSRDDPLSTVVLPHSSSPAGVGCHGADVAEAASVCFSPDRSAPGSSREGPSRRGQSTVGSPVVAGPSMVLGHHITPGRPSMGDSHQEGPADTGGGLNISPSPRAVQSLGLAPEGAQYLEAGLSAGVTETILSSRAPSTRKLYGLKWNVFTAWCRQREVDPVNCPVASVLEFLQDRFSAGLTPPTLKVYVAAIAAFHAPLGDGPLGRQQLVVRFLHGARRTRPAARTRVPTRDLAVVLEGLVEAPFEPLESAEAKNLSLKVAFLLAIISRPGYLPKVPSNVARPVVLQAFHPPPHETAVEERLHRLCPIRALRIYIQRSSSWRKSDQLLVCFGSPKKGLPASKPTIRNWIVQAISSAYQGWMSLVVKFYDLPMSSGYGMRFYWENILQKYISDPNTRRS